ncbi:MAG TPA: ABC transporter permease [Acidimicrobiales bacterium]|nr:ABC transporter permease [Acidimicrobiales bacterium]
MTAPAEVTAPRARPGLDAAANRWRDVGVHTRRNLVHVRREPIQLAGVTIQPVMFTLLFIYVFGSGVPIPGGGDYKDYALAGMLVLNLTTAASRTSVGLATDLHTGVIDRFRTLPMWPAAVLVGRTVADVMAAGLCVIVVALTGLAVGWRPGAGVASVLAGFGVALGFSYALSWFAACLGLATQGPESAQSLSLVTLFPLGLVSNALVPTQGMPGWLMTLTSWNPVSAVTAACRHLFGNPNPSATIHTWPMQHPVLTALGWSAVLVAVCAPLATVAYRRRTTE